MIVGGEEEKSLMSYALWGGRTVEDLRGTFPPPIRVGDKATEISTGFLE